MPGRAGEVIIDISTHAPLARCDSIAFSSGSRSTISTHAPLARCDAAPPALLNAPAFQLTHLLRGATGHAPWINRSPKFQLTHLLRGATSATGPGVGPCAISTHAPLARCDMLRLFQFLPSFISTHAPLARCDCISSTSLILSLNFNSRTSCEVRHGCLLDAICEILFQLTHLLRGATRCSGPHCRYNRFQLTHLLRGATKTHLCTAICRISTHAPLARCDTAFLISSG